MLECICVVLPVLEVIILEVLLEPRLTQVDSEPTHEGEGYARSFC
jgi:hypothetical protein